MEKKPILDASCTTSNTMKNPIGWQSNSLCYCFNVYILFSIDATKETKYLGRLVNHSRKRPNMKVKRLEVDGRPRIFFVAIENIRAGEELLYDYGETDKDIIAANPWLHNS